MQEWIAQQHRTNKLWLCLHTEQQAQNKNKAQHSTEQHRTNTAQNNAQHRTNKLWLCFQAINTFRPRYMLIYTFSSGKGKLLGKRKVV
jgi:hypothetical protein